ncbi:hypothetical protein [Streptomyces rishiriensis]|nr:hypothetical protein [Streptomyces rishiriensis]
MRTGNRRARHSRHVQIAEVEPDRLWRRLLQNQRGALVAYAVRPDTDAVIYRLRFHIS